MARPKTGVPPKRCLNLTVDEQTREKLNMISQYYGKSISSMVSDWAEAMARDIEIKKESEKRISATDTNVGGKLEKCFSCKHFASTEITRCHACNKKNGYRYWEKEGE